MKNKSVAIIGAGAAGCMCAAELSRRRPELEILVFEKGASALAKVAVTGGGRCNLTNTFENIDRLEEAYPRGARLMKRLLGHFSQDDCRRWFEDAGVRLVVQDDGCVFPASQDAMEIVHTLLALMRKGGVKLLCKNRINCILRLEDGGFLLSTEGGPERELRVNSSGLETGPGQKTAGSRFDAVVATCGGAAAGLLGGLGLSLEPDVPSLFTLKIPNAGLRSLMGTTVQNCRLTLAGAGFSSEGILLITDWGVSGPATLKLSSYAARRLSDDGYKGTLLINWTGLGQEETMEMLSSMKDDSPQKMVSNCRPDGISDRLWRMLLSRAGIKEGARWAEIGAKSLKKLRETLCNDAYEIRGRARFKEEFVTCGGLSLSELDYDTLECKRVPGLYAGGEMIDIDAITGGFNLQAAWSCAHRIAEVLAERL